MVRVRGSYPPFTYTWGFELEVGDVDRRLVIPSRYGSWEYAERDIVNLLPPHQYVAADPLGEDPPVGGEVNTVPTRTWREQVELISDLLAWFRANGQVPTAACTTHSHVHVHVPGLVDDIAALKRLTAYTARNQAAAVAGCYGFKDSPSLSSVPGSRTYLKLDGGRLMPTWMSTNIARLATDFQSFIDLQCCGRDGVSRGRPYRYAVNTYCLKHTRTIEFRHFRSTLDRIELESCFAFVERFMDAALNGGPDVPEILAERVFRFPPFRFSADECRGWMATKWGEGRGKKVRRFVPVM